VGVFPTKRCVCNVEQHSQRRGVLGGKGWGLGAFESDFQFVQRLAELNEQSRMLFFTGPKERLCQKWGSREGGGNGRGGEYYQARDDIHSGRGEGVSWGRRFRVLLAPGSAGVRQVFFVALDKLQGGHPRRCLTRVTPRPARSSGHGSLAPASSTACVANPDPAPQPRGLAKQVRILTCSLHTAM